MMQKEAFSYRGIIGQAQIRNQVVGKKEQVRKDSIIIELMLAFCCLIIGRTMILGQVSPVRVSLYAVMLQRKKGRLSAFIAVTAGMFSIGIGGTTFKYIGAMMAVFIILKAVDKIKGYCGIFTAALSVLAALVISNLVYGSLRPGGMLIYDYILMALEGVLGYVMVYVFQHVMAVALEKTRRRILSNEEMISISIFVALLISGLWDVNIFGLSTRNILSILLVLIFSYIGGPGVGASMGIMVGLVLSLSSVQEPVLIAIFGVCGLIAGTFRELGRIFTGCAFILTNALMVFYVNKSTSVILSFNEIVASTIILTILPAKSLKYIGQFLDYTLMRFKEQNYYIKRMQELIVERLTEFSKVFQQLAIAFDSISNKNKFKGQEDISNLFDLIAQKVCKSCSFYENCWNRDFYKTYSIMFELLSTAESKGGFTKKDIPPDLARKCIHMNEVTEAVNQIYDLYSSQLKWREQIDECRQLVAYQLQGVSNVVRQLATEMNIDMSFKKDLEEAVQLELDKAGIRCREVLVVEKSDGNIEVNIRKRPCRGQKECTRKIERIVSQILGKNMTTNISSCMAVGKNECVLQLKEAQRFQVITGISRRACQTMDLCGDSYSFNALPDGKYMLALSDGMGTGSRAAEESSAVISMLENLMEAGFDMDITMRTINSILLVRSREEMFATADLCVLDLVSGSADIVKIGAVSTFIKRRDHVEVIKASTLPIGILDNVQLETVRINLFDEDMIIMVTDGVIDGIKKWNHDDRWLANVISEIDTKNPQEMADYIMDMVLKENDGEPLDDMTVMVSRIWKPAV